MSRPDTVLSRAEISELCATFALGPLRDYRRIEAGTVNSNYRIDAGDTRVFVRVNEGKSEADVTYEADLIDALRAAGIATPRVLATPGGERYVVRRDRPVMIFEWIEGAHRDESAIEPADVAEVCAELAALHRATVDHPDRAGIYGLHQLAGRFEAFRQTDDPALAPAIEPIERELLFLEERRAEREALPRAVIHQDLFADNVLFSPGSKRPVLLDFEQAAAGAMAYDLAVVINAWCVGPGGEPDPARVAAAIDGYGDLEGIGGTPEALWIELRATSVRFAITRITDVYLPGYDRPDKDFRDYLRRLERWRQIGAAGLAAMW